MLSHLKKRLGVLTAIAVLAALVPALAASPASAAPATTAVAAANGATYSACPTGSADDAGFTDTASTDVNCIKMHGITTGVTATTYEPTSNIPRWQMALYLTRFATAAGTTLGSGADQGFTDISGYSAAIQTAINQIKQLGVTTGTTATTYSPDDNVTREQMAMFVERMLAKTAAGVGGTDATATYAGKIGAVTETLTYNYTDIDAGSVTYEGHNAIAEIYHLGIPGHLKTVTTFSPAADITREDMATWMTNALAHTNARPAGVWVQASAASVFGDQAVTLHISHRDANRAAVPGTLIDVFSDLTAANTDPFSATTGLCNAGNTAELGNAGTECAIDLGDVSTDVNGNVGGISGQAGGTVSAATTHTYWAHTGAVGTKFNNLTMTANTVSRSQSTAATVLKLTNTIPTYNVNDGNDTAFELVRYGTSVTITGTLRTSATGTVVPMAAVVSVVDTVVQLVDDGAGIDSGGSDVTTSVTTTAGATGADGVWTHTITQADPSALTTNLNRTQTTSVITVDLNADGVAETAAGTVSIAWDDNASLGNTATMTEGSYYGVGLATAAGGVARTNTVKVHDQFGAGLANQVVTFTVASTTGSGDVAEPFTDGATRTTDTTGTATMSYTDVQTLTAKVVTNASPAVGTDATSTYYRVDGTTPDFAEVDTTVDDGATVANTFTATASTDVVLFGAVHNLVTGDEVIITTAPNADGTVLVDNSEWYVVLDTTAPTTSVTFHTTRTVSALGVVSYGTAANVAADAGGTSPGVAEVNNGWVHASDRVMEIMIHDAANDKLVVQSQIAADNWDYHAYTYDSGDQFNVYADGQGSNTLTPASMATFETHAGAKMTAVTGTPNAGFDDDIVGITYVNDVAGGGTSVFSLGS